MEIGILVRDSVDRYLEQVREKGKTKEEVSDEIDTMFDMIKDNLPDETMRMMVMGYCMIVRNEIMKEIS